MSNTLTERFNRTVRRHFVTLSCNQSLPGGTEENAIVFSGFLVEVKELWFYITAGHVLRRIREAIESGAMFDIWRLSDHTDGNQFPAIPIDFNEERWVVVRNQSVGLDYAALPLNYLEREQLQAGGVEPLAKPSWADPLTEHDQWVLIGVPSESVEYDGETMISSKYVSVLLGPADEPEAAGQKAQNQFYAQLDDGSQEFVDNVEGMSGGPLFAVKYDGPDLKYGVIGVQSSWYSDRRIIAACPFTSFGLALEKAIEEAEL